MKRRLLLPFLISLCWGQSLFADELRIESTPPGATIEIEGKVVGTTPHTSKKLPGGYFHKTATVFRSPIGATDARTAEPAGVRHTGH